MTRKYNIEADDSQIEELDSSFYEYGIDEHVWFEDNNSVIITENPRVIGDLEQILADMEIEYSVSEED